MNAKPGDFIVYTNADGTKETLVAVDNTHGTACQGCVGQDALEVCSKLDLCSYKQACIIWKEAV